MNTIDCKQKTPLSIDYIGSKKSLLCNLDKVFEKLKMDESTVFGDLFAGTGAVSRFVSSKYKCKVIANDLLYVAFVINKAKLTKYSRKEIDLIQTKIDLYNKLTSLKGEVSTHFAPPKRNYFTKQNAGKIDAIREQLRSDRKKIPQSVYYYLMAAFLSAIDKVSNVSVVYAAYLKEFKSAAQETLYIEPFDPHLQNQVTHNAIVLNKDASGLSCKFDVVYLDPPYNTRQYGDNYHVLESIASEHPFVLHGKTGMSNHVTKSAFAKKKLVKDAFQQLLENLNTKVIILSYSSDGLLSKEHILRLLKRLGPTTVKTIPYKKFKSHSGVIGHEVLEYVFLCHRI